MNRLLRIDVDTSVLGGCFDEEFSPWSKRLINEFKEGLRILVISDITLRELEEAPSKIKELLRVIPEENKEYVLLEEETKTLALYRTLPKEIEL